MLQSASLSSDAGPMHLHERCRLKSIHHVKRASNHTDRSRPQVAQKKYLSARLALLAHLALLVFLVFFSLYFTQWFDFGKKILHRADLGADRLHVAAVSKLQLSLQMDSQ